MVAYQYCDVSYRRLLFSAKKPSRSPARQGRYATSAVEKYSRLAIPLLAIIMFVQQQIDLNPDIEEAVFFSIISLLGAALSSLYPDLQEHWEKRQFNQQINFRHILLNQLSRELNQDLWNLRKRTTLADSFFSLQFKNAKLKTYLGDLQVPQKDIHKAILFSLLKYDFPLLAYDNDRIIISAEQRMTAAIRDVIAKSCLEHIVLMSKKTKLEEQLANLIKPLAVDTTWLPEDISVTAKLPNFAFHILLNKDAAEKIHAALNYLIKEKAVSKEKIHDATYHVTVTGIVEIDKTKLDNRISALSVRNSPEDSISLTHSTIGINRRKKAPNSTAGNAPVKQPNARTEDNLVQVNFGMYGIFNSKNKTSDIIEIRAPFWPRYCHFGFFATTQNDFADRRKFEKFKNIFDNGEELVAPTGQQGIVQTKRLVRVGDKWELRNSLKLKATDEDLRVYADESVHAGTKVLHVFNTVTRRTHR